MRIQDLRGIELADIVDSLLEAFSDYFVKMPTSIDYWAQRFAAGRVDPTLSFGMFDKSRLVGFVLHGIDHRQGVQTAFNVGTGVIAEYRGEHITEQIYAHALPLLRQAGIEHCALEVIRQNRRAIAVYERIGFRIERELCCFRGKWPTDLPPGDLHIEPVPFAEIEVRNAALRPFFAWDSDNAAMRLLPAAVCYKVFINNRIDIGYFIMNKNNQAIYQVELWEGQPDAHWLWLCYALAQISTELRLNNVDSRRRGLIEALESLGMAHSWDQYEMGRSC